MKCEDESVKEYGGYTAMKWKKQGTEDRVQYVCKKG